MHLKILKLTLKIFYRELKPLKAILTRRKRKNWDVWGNVFFVGTTLTSSSVGLSTTDNTLPDNSLINRVSGIATAAQLALPAPQLRFLVSGSTTVYIVAQATGTGTLSGSGGIYARRRS